MTACGSPSSHSHSTNDSQPSALSALTLCRSHSRLRLSSQNRALVAGRAIVQVPAAAVDGRDLLAGEKAISGCNGAGSLPPGSLASDGHDATSPRRWKGCCRGVGSGTRRPVAVGARRVRAWCLWPGLDLQHELRSLTADVQELWESLRPEPTLGILVQEACSAMSG